MNEGPLHTPTYRDFTQPLVDGIQRTRTTRKALRTLNQKSFQKISSTIDNECPQNGSTYGSMAPSTGLECPHEGPSVGFEGREDSADHCRATRVN